MFFLRCSRVRVREDSARLSSGALVRKRRDLSGPDDALPASVPPAVEGVVEKFLKYS
jgi:hypothetical protein